jgi:hypothetical protein
MWQIHVDCTRPTSEEDFFSGSDQNKLWILPRIVGYATEEETYRANDLWPYLALHDGWIAYQHMERTGMWVSTLDLTRRPATGRLCADPW